MNDKKLSFNSIHPYIASITHFFQMNDVVLNWKKLVKFKGNRRLVVEDKPYSKEQIRQMLDFSDLRLKCIILLKCSALQSASPVPPSAELWVTQKVTEAQGFPHLEDYYLLTLHVKGEFHNLAVEEDNLAVEEYYLLRYRYHERRWQPMTSGRPEHTFFV